MSASPVRYQSHDEDSARWDGFVFRPRDIVISSRSKTGTTWMQMICALMIFQSAELPAPVSQLSPWLDWLVEPTGEVHERLAAQTHRRFIKTHTPLDGIPLDPRATYIVTARHPLDSAVSLYHHVDNLDRKRIRQLTGEPEPTVEPKPRPTVREWLLTWIDRQVDPELELDSLPGVMWHLCDAWRRREDPRIVLIHYQDLCDHLDAEMRRLASRLDIEVPEARWPALVEAATFDQMRASAQRAAPDAGVLKSSAAFFRRGGSGSGRELLTDDELTHYYARAAEFAPADLLAWLHR